MPFVALMLLALTEGLIIAKAAQREVLAEVQHPLLLRAFAAFALHSALVVLPAGVYLYVFHGDWFVGYMVSVSAVPSAFGLLLLMLVPVAAVLGYWLGAVLVRRQRGGWNFPAAALVFAASLGLLLALKHRVSVVGTTVQFEGQFGMRPLASSSLLVSLAIVLGSITLSFGWLWYRISRGAPRVGESFQQ